MLTVKHSDLMIKQTAVAFVFLTQCHQRLVNKMSHTKI
jgi:hypothetical protein